MTAGKGCLGPPPPDVYGRFENTADKSVVLDVGPSADGANAREVTVVPWTP